MGTIYASVLNLDEHVTRQQSPWIDNLNNRQKKTFIWKIACIFRLQLSTVYSRRQETDKCRGGNYKVLFPPYATSKGIFLWIQE